MGVTISSGGEVTFVAKNKDIKTDREEPKTIHVLETSVAFLEVVVYITLCSP